MKKLKITALIIALVIFAGAFSGCGDKETNADDFTEITWWSTNSHSKAVMTELVKEFNNTIGKENKVRLVMEVKEDVAQQLKIALQSGNEPDLFSPSVLSEFAENNYIVPLDEVEGLEDLIAKNSDFRNHGTNVWNDKLYMLPVSCKLYGLAYNKDMFKAAGIVDKKGNAKPPKTIDEMVEAAKKLTDKSKQQFGIILPIKWTGWFNNEIANNAQRSSGMQNGNYNINEGVYDFNGIKPLAEAILQMKKDGSVYPGAESVDNDPARARFAEGNIGMKFAITWDVGVWNDQFKANCDWGVAPAPVAKKGEEYYSIKSPGMSVAIGRKGLEEKGAEKISLVYNWLYSDDVLVRLCEESVEMPWRADIIEKCDFSKAKKGWADFAEILKYSDKYNPPVPRDISAYDTDGVDFVNRVWSGKISLDKWIDERNKISNEGIELYKKNNPEIDFSWRIVPDYDTHYKNK